MKLVHLSYVNIPEHDPERWLDRINFFCGVAEGMAATSPVTSIHCIDYEGVLNRNGVTYQFFRQSYLDSLFPRRIHVYIRDLQPDAVIVHGLRFPWQVIQLRLFLPKSTRLFLQNHAEQPMRFHKKFIQQYADRGITGYFFSASEQANSWISKKQIRSWSKIHQVMEVSSPFFSMPQEKARQNTLVKGKNNYLWVGRLDKNKDPFTLLKAFMKFLEVEKEAFLYLIFQQCDLLDELQKLVEHFPGKSQIVFVGEVDHGELIFWYNSVNFILSTSHYEGSGVAVCEAMSCGCIPIVTNIPSFRMMTNEGMCGFLFEPGDADDLSKKLHQSLTLNISSQRSKVLHQFHANLSYEAIASKIMQVVKDSQKVLPSALPNPSSGERGPK